MVVKKIVLLLLLPFLIVLEISSVLAINITGWNITYEGNPYNQTFREITNQNEIVFEWINATADGVANWSLVLWNGTNNIIENISLKNEIQELSIPNVSINISALIDGTYYINLTAVNSTNSTDTYSVKIMDLIIDRTPPKILIDLGGYTNGTWTNQDVTVSITIIEDNLKKATLTINGTEYDITNNLTNGTYSRTFSDEGIYIINVTAEDEAGNFNVSKTYEIKIDKTPPEIYIIFPKNGTIYGKEDWKEINVSFTDNLSDINSSTAKIILDGSEDSLSISNGYYYYNISIESLGTGWHNLTISVSDNAGNNKLIEIRFGIDITEPYIRKFEIPTIYENVLRGRVSIEFSVEDNFTNITKIECYVTEKESGKKVLIFSKEYKGSVVIDKFEWDSVEIFGYVEELPIIIECYFRDYKDNVHFVKKEYILMNYLLPDISETEKVVRTDISLELKRIGIDKIIEKIVPIENIKKVNIEEEEKITLDEEKAKRILDVIGNYVERELPENVEIKIFPKKIDIKVKLIKLDCENETIYLTKFEKEVSRNVIIYISKKIVEKASDIIFIKGKIVKVYEEDPIIEVSPEKGKIEYVVKGNKIKFADEIYMYEYKIKEKEVEEEVVKEEKITEKKLSEYPKEEKYEEKKGKGIISLWYLSLIAGAGIVAFLLFKHRRRS